MGWLVKNAANRQKAKLYSLQSFYKPATFILELIIYILFCSWLKLLKKLDIEPVITGCKRPSDWVPEINHLGLVILQKRIENEYF